MALPAHRSNKYRFTAVAVVGLLLFVLAGCPSILSKVDKFKSLHQDGRFEQLAAMEVSCDAGDQGCNQLHLLKGDACFRLAKNPADTAGRPSNLECAAEELTTGIKTTRDWNKVSIDRAQVYENACEAARLSGDFGDRSHFEALLAANAEQFLNFAPDNPGAIYYNARAEYFTLTQSQNPCTGWQTLRARVDTALQRFQTNPRYRKPYQALRGLIAIEQGTRCGN